MNNNDGKQARPRPCRHISIKTLKTMSELCWESESPGLRVLLTRSRGKINKIVAQSSSNEEHEISRRCLLFPHLRWIVNLESFQTHVNADIPYILNKQVSIAV